MTKPRRSSTAWVVARVAVGGAMLGVIVAALLLPLGAPHASKVTTYLGRFHVLALHVPIGVLVMALAGEAATMSRRMRRQADVVVGFALPLLVLTGAGAVALGLMLAHGGHFPRKTVELHRNLTIVGILLAGAAALLWPRRRTSGRALHRVVLGASALSLTVGAHFGGSLTHGSDYLTAPVADERATVTEEDAGSAEDAAGEPIAPDAGGPDASVVADASAVAVAVADATAPAADATTPAADAAAPPIVKASPPPKPSLRAQAQAIVNRRCGPCHTTNQRGGLRLTDLGKPLKRGALVPGDPGSSTLYTRLVLPLDDDDHMPPADGPQLTKGEIATIRAFIAEQKPAP